MLFQSANSNADWAIQQTVAMLDELVAPWGGVFGAASRLVTPILRASPVITRICHPCVFSQKTGMIFADHPCHGTDCSYFRTSCRTI